MNRDIKVYLRQTGVFLLCALFLSALCVTVDRCSYTRRNRQVCAQVESLLSRTYPEPLTRVSGCRRMPQIPDVCYFVAETAGKNPVYPVWFAVSSFSGPEMPLFVVPQNSGSYADIVYYGDVATGSADGSRLTDAAVAGCKKRLYAYFSTLIETQGGGK